MATYTITNILTNPSFENTGWAANSNASISYVTSPVHSGSYALKVNSTSSSETLIVTSDTLPLIDEHIYYCGVYFWEDTAVCTSMQVYWPIAEPTWGDSYVDSTKLGQWQRLGWRIIRSAWSSSSYQFRFDFEGMASGTYVYIDDAVLIDLTACFGSGNEPTRDWCDTFIPYFTGSTTVEYNKYDLVTASPTSFKVGDVINCTYSGLKKHLILPPGKYKLECWGAQGGTYNSSYASGGNGGYSQGTLTIKKPTPIYMYSGGQGSYGSSSTYTAVSGGGFNGGGNAGYRGGGGGGASDIRLEVDSLYSRVIVAGGGGGAYAYNTTYKAAGGAGGGSSGVAGSYYSSSYTTFVGQPGTQTAGGASPTAVTNNYSGGAGSFGTGGSTGYKYNSTSYYSNGGGGGGWYGGSAADNHSSSSRARAAGGGGGSGYVFTSTTISNYPQGCFLKEQYYLENTQLLTGASRFLGITGDYETGHAGNGHTKISVLELFGNKYIKDNFYGQLPSSYTQLDYIESNGTQYIDTGLYYNSTMRIVADVQPFTHSAHACLCSSRDGTQSNTMMILLLSGVNWNIDRGSSATNRHAFSTVSNRKRIIIDLNQGNATVDTVNYTYPTDTFSATSSTIQIFRDGYGSQYYLSAKLFSFKIYDNTTLKRNFIPAMRNSDNKIGLYDLVGQTFYTDVAGGNFTGQSLKISSTNTLYYFNGESLNDQSGNNNGVTNHNISIDTSYKKFNNSSMYFDGSSYLSLDQNYITGTNDWTIDWWEYRLDTTSNRAVYHSNYAANTGYGMLIGYSSGNNVYAYATSASGTWNIFSQLNMGTLQPKTWVHRAMVRKGSNFYTFENGNLVATVSSSASIAGNLTPTIGFYDYSTDYYFYGYIDNLRISKIARWTSDFIPPILEYGNDWKLIDKIYLKTDVSWGEEE